MNNYLKLYETTENNMVRKIKKMVNEYKKIFLLILMIGVFTHLFALTNKLLNWDEIACLFSKGGTYKLGRWLLDTTQYIFPNFSMPSFNGLIAIIFISLSACLISDILEIKSNLNKILIGAIMQVFPVITCTLTYMFTVHSYMLGMFLAVLAVYFCKKRSKISFIFSIIFMVFSLAIYQAYISIASTLLLLILIKNCFSSTDLKELVLQALKFLSMLIISLILYAVINKMCIVLMGITLSSYQGVATMGRFSIKGILIGIVKSYEHIFEPIIHNTQMTSMMVLRIIYVICILLNIVLFIFELLKNKKNILLEILFFLLLPISMNMMYILNENVTNHCLMMYGDIFVFIGSVFIIDGNNIKNYLSRFIKLLLIIQIFFYAVIANEVYLKLHLAYENTFAFYEGVIEKIENTPGFDENTKIAILGRYDSKELNQIEQFNNIEGLTGVASNGQLINSNKINFIQYYIGFNGSFINEEQAKQYIENNGKTEEFKNMPNYPYYGSVKKINDLIVVKFSE